MHTLYSEIFFSIAVLRSSADY